jgi:hypothetical protein
MFEWPMNSHARTESEYAGLPIFSDMVRRRTNTTTLYSILQIAQSARNSRSPSEDQRNCPKTRARKLQEFTNQITNIVSDSTLAPLDLGAFHMAELAKQNWPPRCIWGRWATAESDLIDIGSDMGMNTFMGLCDALNIPCMVVYKRSYFATRRATYDLGDLTAQGLTEDLVKDVANPESDTNELNELDSPHIVYCAIAKNLYAEPRFVYLGRSTAAAQEIKNTLYFAPSINKPVPTSADANEVCTKLRIPTDVLPTGKRRSKTQMRTTTLAYFHGIQPKAT